MITIYQTSVKIKLQSQRRFELVSHNLPKRFYSFVYSLIQTQTCTDTNTYHFGPDPSRKHKHSLKQTVTGFPLFYLLTFFLTLCKHVPPSALKHARTPLPRSFGLIFLLFRAGRSTRETVTEVENVIEKTFQLNPNYENGAKTKITHPQPGYIYLVKLRVYMYTASCERLKTMNTKCFHIFLF